MFRAGFSGGVLDFADAVHGSLVDLLGERSGVAEALLLKAAAAGLGGVLENSRGLPCFWPVHRAVHGWLRRVPAALGVSGALAHGSSGLLLDGVVEHSGEWS